MHHAVANQRTITGRPPGRAFAPTVVAVIARGGMGYVELCWRADRAGGRWVARKRLHAQFRGDPQFRAMFTDEARLARLVRHRNVVAASEVGEDADGPYLIMDYVEGISLARLVRQAARARRLIPTQVALRICRQVALGLHAAHEAVDEDGCPLNLVHRDVSPQNVLIGFDGSVRVTDFGIAKALGNENRTVTGVLKGNMGYLAPEQLRFEEPDRRSDLFSLGVTLFELLSGARLYRNRVGFEGTRRILSEPPPDIRGARPDAPPALARLLLQMLSKRTTDRPSTALEVAARLKAVASDLAATESPISVAAYVDRNLAKERERHRLIVAHHLQRAERRAVTGLPPAASRPVRRQRWVVLLSVLPLTFMAVALAGDHVRDVARPTPVAPSVAWTRPSRPIEVVPLPIEPEQLAPTVRPGVEAPRKHLHRQRFRKSRSENH
ncbi:MAG TPA: serine/threonine-protein kinase [Polyangia bacterium]|nr:serine/threonine-protein kinase [Polyangia bacterium]